MTELVADGKMDEATKLFPQVQKAIDMAVKKNLMPKNTAARRKSNLAKLIGQNKKVEKKETTKAPAAKKAAPKKPAAKPAAKKA
jgi:histone H1/5